MNDILDTSEVPSIAGLQWIGSDDAISKLIAEFAAARLEFGSIEKDREGQYGNQRFKYSPLGTLTEATAKPLARHGIVVLQHITNSPVEGKHRLHTTIAGHGARIVASLDFAPQQAKEDGAYKGEWIKEYGKLCTYLCRYAYKTTMVLDSEPDADDAEAPPLPQKRREAPTPPQARQESRPAPQRQQEPASIRQPGAPQSVASNQPQRREAPANQSAPAGSTEAKQASLQVVPPPTKSDPLAEKLSTPVTPVAPPEPTVERDEDPPASTELQDELLKAFRASGMTKIEFGTWCLKEFKVSSPELREKTSLATKALEAIRVWKRPEAGAA